MKRTYYGISLLMLFTIVTCASAKNDTIYFGGQNGSPNFGYSPSTLTVNVGDVIVWVGAFSAPHTLQSEAIPTGAAAFSKLDMTGNSFSYTVTVAGTYNYECTLHASLGMTGSFTAAAAGVEIPQETSMTMDPIYPNPAMDQAMVHFTLDAPTHVTLRIYNATGTLVQTPTNDDMDAGFHMLMIDTKLLPSGSYQYVLQAGDAVLQRSAIVVK